MTERKNKRLRFRTKALLVVATLFLLTVAGWFFFKNIVASKLEQQLLDLGLGKPNVGNISFSPGGMVASQIEFSNSNKDSEPWLTVERLAIEHPLWGLIKGDETFQQIDVYKFRAIIAAADAASDQPGNDFNLSQISFPTDTVRILDSQILIREPNRLDFPVEGIDATIAKSELGWKIDGKIQDLVGGAWTLDGNLDSTTESFQAKLASDKVRLTDGQWQQWPGITATLGKYFRADSVARVDLTLSGNPQQPFEYVANIDLQQAALFLPLYDLPVTVKSGTARIADGRIDYQDVVATIDGQDQLFGTGSTVIDRFPVETKFQGTFKGVDIASLRRLVPEVPALVAGRTDGVFSGGVDVERSTRTTVTVSADVNSSSGAYGSIKAESLTAKVEVQPLIIDDEQQQESLAGSVVVQATSRNQPVNEIFATFELGELARQLEIATKGTGSFRLDLPLSTANDMATWKMNFASKSKSGTLNKQPIRDLQLIAELNKGNLVFTQFTATPIVPDPKTTSASSKFDLGVVDEATSPFARSVPGLVASSGVQGLVASSSVQGLVASYTTGNPKLETGSGTGPNITKPENKTPNQGPRLDLTLDWPLTESAAHPNLGLLKIKGQQVPVPWLNKFIQRQIELTASPGNTDNQRAPTWHSQLDRLQGAAVLAIDLSIDTKRPDSILAWSATGSLADSSFNFGETGIRKTKSDFLLKDGFLNFDDLAAEFSGGGELTGDVRIDINNGKSHSANLESKNMPLEWLVAVAGQTSQPAKSFLDSIEIHLEKPGLNLEGILAASLAIRSDLDNFETPWTVSANVAADQIRIKNQRLNHVKLDGNLDQNTLRITTAHVEIGNEGKVDLQGDWQFENEIGQADVVWNQLPISRLKELGVPVSPAIAGNTSGKVNISKTTNSHHDPSLETNVNGRLSFTGLEYSGIGAAKLDLDIRSEKGIVFIDEAPSDADLFGLNLVGQVGMRKPFPFSFSGAVREQPLAEITLASNDASNDPSQSATPLWPAGEISGTGNAKFVVEGELSPWAWSSTGELSISEPGIRNQPLSDIVATWSHLNSDWTKSKASLQILGGKIELTELSQSPQQLKIAITGIDAQELNSLASLPIEFAGDLTGEASVQQWDSTEPVLANLTLSGVSIETGLADISELSGQFDYQNRQLRYKLAGQILGGSIVGEGSTGTDDISAAKEYPLQVRLADGSLRSLFGESKRFRSLRPMVGRVSANADLKFYLDRSPQGQGRVQVDDLRWNQELVTRAISSRVNLNDNVLRLEGLRADMRSGEISGTARIPIASNSAGTYQFSVRQLDLKRILDVVLEKPIDATGLLEAKISGQIGNVISGQGIIGLSRARVFGLEPQSLNLPIQFKFQPEQQTARIELPRSRFQLFNGDVNGHATIDVGRQLNFVSDFKVSNLNTKQLFSAVGGQGDLSGALKIQGNAVRSLRDLDGTFKGKLQRTEAFKLPLLDGLANFIGGTQLSSKQFDSDEINLLLNRGRIEVKQLNLSNSIAQIAISGYAFLDGRLDLDVAGKIDKLNQPTLLDQLAGSPLSRFQGSTVALLAQAAEFLSERLVFVKIGGSFRQPHFRLDTGQQVREETIRYFLRGSQILPFTDRPIK